MKRLHGERGESLSTEEGGQEKGEDVKWRCGRGGYVEESQIMKNLNEELDKRFRTFHDLDDKVARCMT